VAEIERIPTIMNLGKTFIGILSKPYCNPITIG